MRWWWRTSIVRKIDSSGMVEIVVLIDCNIIVIEVGFKWGGGSFDRLQCHRRGIYLVIIANTNNFCWVHSRTTRLNCYKKS